MKKIRVDMRIPESLLKRVSEYQEKHGITTRTSAFLELVRKALEADQKSDEASK